MSSFKVAGSIACYNLGPAEQIPLGEGRQFVISGLRIAVFRTRTGKVHATQAECPHQAGPLADGILGGSTVICPLHARKFHLETGAQIGGDCTIATYPVYLSDNSEIILELKTHDQ